MKAVIPMRTYRAVALALLASLLALTAASARAQQWPQRPIFFIVPFPAGGGTDNFARPLAAQMDRQLDQRILIENRGGAGGTIGAAAAARAAADGYTLLVGAAHHAIAQSIYAKLSYNIETDFVPIAMISRPSHVIVVNPQKVAAKTVKELAAAAGAEPGKMTYATPGVGTTQHLAAELFKVLTKTQIAHVPYRGAGPMMQDLIGGHVHMSIDVLASSAPAIRGGQIRALAVTSNTRVPTFPDVPTAAEAGLADFEFATWYGLWAPRGTPSDIVARMMREVERALRAPEIIPAWERYGSDVPALSGDEFGRFISAEVKRWGDVVTAAGLKQQAP